MPSQLPASTVTETRLEHLGIEYAEAEQQLDGAYQLWEELNGQLETLAIAAPVA